MDSLWTSINTNVETMSHRRTEILHGSTQKTYSFKMFTPPKYIFISATHLMNHKKINGTKKTVHFITASLTPIVIVNTTIMK